MTTKVFPNYPHLPIINATTALPLEIAECDIRGAMPQDPGRCAAARALLRGDPLAEEVAVHRSRTYVRYDDHILRYGTPNSLKAETEVFDRAGIFTAQSFVLPPLSASKRPNGRRQGSDAAKTYAGKRQPARILHNVRPAA